MEQTEQADPDIEELVYQNRVAQCLGTEVKQQEAGGKQPVNCGHQVPDVESRDRGTV